MPLPEKKPGGVALLAMLKPKGPAKSDDMPSRKPGALGGDPAEDEGGYDDGAMEVAGSEVLDAVKSGDGGALARALCDLIDLHTHK